MSAVHPNASWNPAFRPDSTATESKTESYGAINAAATEENREIEDDTEGVPRPSTPNTETPNQYDAATTLEHPGGNEEHPELGSLREALTTSLGSPGGVEMDNNPSHAPETIKEEEQGQTQMTYDRAEIPSSGPSNTNKHMSNISFTRTVGEDVDWGEDDEVDPEWNLQSKDDDPFQSMPPTDRTNSFPAVPPAHVANETTPNGYHSQAGDIMLREEDNTYNEPSSAPQTKKSHRVKQSIDWGTSGEYGDDEFNLGMVQGGDIGEESMEASQYEEGVHLVQSTHLSPPVKGHKKMFSTSKLFDDIEAEDDGGFFSTIGSDTTEQPPKLDRKSTSEVLNSISHDLHAETNGNITDGGHESRRAKSISATTGGGIATSKSTLISDVLASIADTNEEAVGEDNVIEESKPSEENLAAKWQAALDADEFLEDDDDLLPDEVPELTPELDPEAVFGSDDEGFLEDDEPELAIGPDSQNQIPSFPKPITDPNGNVIGFDQLIGSAQTTGQSAQNRYMPTAAAQTAQQQPKNMYEPATPLFTDLSGQFNPAGTYGTTQPSGQGPRPSSSGFGAQPPAASRPDLGPKAQSFADKTKGGYSSPYDLPMDVTKPRKRVSMQQMSAAYGQAPAPTPPLRSNSMHIQNQPQTSPAFPSPPMGSMGPPTPSAPQGFQPPPKQGPPTLKSKGSSFFEELPVVAKQRAPRAPSQPVSPSLSGLEATGGGSPPATSMGPPQIPPPRQQYAESPTAAHGLVTSPPVNPYSPIVAQEPKSAPASSRYSPAPVQQQPAGYAPAPVQAQSAYSPAPVQQPATAYSPVPAQQPSHGYSPVPVQQPSAGYSPAPAQSPATGYSPAPVQQQPAAPPQGKYGATPPLVRHVIPPYAAAPLAPNPPFAHQPRTSSPLAQFERSSEHEASASPPANLGYGRTGRRESSSYGNGARDAHLTLAREATEHAAIDRRRSQDQAGLSPQESQATSQLRPGLTAPLRSPHESGLMSPPKRSLSHAPDNREPLTEVEEPAFQPPKRSQTQSPGSATSGPRSRVTSGEILPRPPSSSVQSPTSPPRQSRAYAPITAEATAPTQKVHARTVSQGLDYIEPTDGRQHDPLQRWKGAPVFAWGSGGTVITSFPKEVPRYGMGSNIPMIQPSPGEVKVRSIKDIYALDERTSNFPGPLKGKAKKKDVLTWLSKGIESLERQNDHFRSLSSLSHDDMRKEERVVLWKILKAFVENNGVLEANAEAEKAVRSILSPELDNEGASSAPFAIGSDLGGIHRAAGSTILADPVDPVAVDTLRKQLLKGEREKAVWSAVDNRLWAHALLLSNTISPDLYKRVAQEFVQKEVKNIGENTESLAALYEIFAGNHEECVDELVPPSARAGFQMVSTSATTGPSKSAVEGLNHWRETLGLILSNRSADDSKAIQSIGKLLAGYGRSEAAHICFIFARSRSVFGGIDDSQSDIVLVGADHQRDPYGFDKDTESILLSEIYEFGQSLSSTSSVPILIPHLAVYKMQHAKLLTAFGQKSKALEYCEFIASSITSQTRRSTYHHPLLVSELDDLSKRLKQSPKDETSSWIAKPSIDKVSSSVWTKFNKFVAGDEKDEGPAGGDDISGDVGPFARIAGGTPTISRTPSVADIYSQGNIPNTTSGAIPIPIGGKTVSRYAPGGSYGSNAAMGSSFGSPAGSPYAGLNIGLPIPAPHGQQYPASDSRVLSSGSFDSRYAPTSHPEYAPAPQVAPTSHADYSPQYGASYASSPNEYRAPEYNQAQPPKTDGDPDGYHAPQTTGTMDPSGNYPLAPITPSSFEPPTYNPYETQPPTSFEAPASAGYSPPEQSGYIPPSYEPNQMNDEPSSPIDTGSKKKSFMDDEDETPRKPSGGAGEMTKAEKDRAADEAFRKAAEEDEKRSSSQPQKKGWGLTGWFSKKEASPAEPQQAQPGKPIKAKLGEASSFYYDPELKRWVNKKGGKDEQAKVGITPPPPKAGPPRSEAGSAPPGMGVTSAPRSASSSSYESTPPLRAGSPGSFAVPGTQSEPPVTVGSLEPPVLQRNFSNTSTRSVSGGSNPSSRPNTGMSNASSIDDLLGPPVARKAGDRAKKGKKGRGYIDVMGDKAAASG
ncbi:hypothetical protein V496_00461 [Pseudogymnoascus sp. VKM F-4515 (FW-2607)]|nr:hypothetical protein V496_00461 [Pseudogymnoascus sp. VKM F-4515 (FW-2607)]KFY94629.1 hypothetical protein V498_03811 [Pseudogymnoascus sp. VKM F-4517 (FW-2822)]